MATYIPQTTYYYPDNVYTSTYYQASNSTYYALPNCTRYCYGRWWALLGAEPTFMRHLGNAETWWTKAPASIQRGSTPKLGAIICLANGPYSGWGHVAIVEKIDADGTCHFSESNFKGAYFQYDVRHGNASNNYGYGEYDFQGFLYFPYDYDPDVDPTPPPDPPDPPTPAPTPGGNRFTSNFFLYTKRRPF